MLVKKNKNGDPSLDPLEKTFFDSYLAGVKATSDAALTACYVHFIEPSF